MSQNGTLSPKQNALLLALITGEKVEAAAKTAKISTRTAFRWQKQEAFQSAMKEAQEQAFEKKLDFLKQGVGSAIAALGRNLSERAPAHVQVTAARAWLELTIELYKIEQVENRLAELEALLNGGPYAPL